MSLRAWFLNGLESLLFRPSGLGKKAEQAAAHYLRKQGHRILHRNYRNQIGEIDLITTDRGQLVFVEVRSRTSSQHGDPLETIDHTKQRQILRTAQGYLQSRPNQQKSPRFDVIGIIWNDQRQIVKFQYVPHAFTA